MRNFTPYLFTFLILMLASCKKEQQKEDNPFKNSPIAEYVSYDETKFPSYNANYPPPPGAKKIFELSQDYPKEFQAESYPWLEIDFRQDPDNYIDKVLKYCLEGNIEVNFKGQANKVRKWYHAPWLHDDGRYANDSIYVGNGREYINGLTRERATPIRELHPDQDVKLENWAVGMYNAPGGNTIGKVWSSTTLAPQPMNSTFPEGTVTFKLLFTDGAVDKVPFLKGTLEWEANIYPCDPTSTNCKSKKRINRTVRLLQIDVAVKDKRSPVGWVFGTFIYDGARKGSSVWERMVPVGLSWGDDPTVTALLNKEGAFENSELKESYLNKSLISSGKIENPAKAFMTHHGLGGRLNGPVDNPISSCVSCHGQAGVSQNGFPMAMGDFSAQRKNYPIASFELYFSNPKPGAYKRIFQNKEYTTTDFSLQLSAGIRNYYNNEQIKNKLLAKVESHSKAMESFSVEDVSNTSREVERIPEVTRGE